MGWIKVKLPEKWHNKLKHYRDETNCKTLTDAGASLIQKGIVAYESENGTLESTYDKEEHPTWNDD